MIDAAGHDGASLSETASRRRSVATKSRLANWLRGAKSQHDPLSDSLDRPCETHLGVEIWGGGRFVYQEHAGKC